MFQTTNQYNSCSNYLAKKTFQFCRLTGTLTQVNRTKPPGCDASIHPQSSAFSTKCSTAATQGSSPGPLSQTTGRKVWKGHLFERVGAVFPCFPKNAFTHEKRNPLRATKRPHCRPRDKNHSRALLLGVSIPRTHHFYFLWGYLASPRPYQPVTEIHPEQIKKHRPGSLDITTRLTRLHWQHGCP